MIAIALVTESNRAGRHEVELQLSAVIDVLDEPCASPRFAPANRTVH